MEGIEFRDQERIRTLETMETNKYLKILEVAKLKQVEIKEK